MGLTDDAKAQEVAFAQAALSSPIRQVRSEMKRRAKEWADAIELLDHVGNEDYEIDLAGAIAPGDRIVALVATPYSEDRDRETVGVLRVLHRDGQTSLHLAANSNGREVYVNFAGPSSPVVVQR